MQACSCFYLLLPGTAQAISVGQIDTFEDGTIQGWKMGFNAVTASHMASIADGGPAGVGDKFLQVTADGTTIAGGRLTLFNQAQWSGDYLSADIARRRTQEVVYLLPFQPPTCESTD